MNRPEPGSGSYIKLSGQGAVVLLGFLLCGVSRRRAGELQASRRRARGLQRGKTALAGSGRLAEGLQRGKTELRASRRRAGELQRGKTELAGSRWTSVNKVDTR
jgi:hypothetical protein